MIDSVKEYKMHKRFIIRLDQIYKFGGIMSLYTTYKQLDELYNNIVSFTPV